MWGWGPAPTPFLEKNVVVDIFKTKSLRSRTL